MSLSFLQQVAGCAGKRAVMERQQGKASSANGFAMIAFGILLLPIPVIGIPLIILGIGKLGK